MPNPFKIETCQMKKNGETITVNLKDSLLFTSRGWDRVTTANAPASKPEPVGDTRSPDKGRS